MLKISKMKALEMINDAKEKSLETAIPLLSSLEYSDQILSKKIFYSTGSRNLDNILGGGISTMEITGLRGEFGVGKSQVCFSTSVSCLQKKRKVAWIETEPSTFFPERLEEISMARGFQTNIGEEVMVIPAKFIKTPNHLFLSYQRVERAIERGSDFGLIVIDSFSSPFRQMYTTRELFRARSEEVARHLGYLQKLCSKYNLAVMLTVQIMGIPDAGRQLEVMMKETSDKAMYGGEVLKHGVQTWISLRQKSRSQMLWEASIFDSSHLPPNTAEFVIDSSGVRDPQVTKVRL
jgi:RecA/RadA recombinase